MSRLLARVALFVALGWAGTMLMAFGYGKLVPQTYTSPELQAFEEKLKLRGYLTKEELEQMDREAALLNEQVRRKIREEDKSLWFGELRSRALAVSWLPWALIGFASRRDARVAWFVSATLFLLVAGHALPLKEASAFSAATLIAFYIRYLPRYFAESKGPGSN